MNTEILIIEDDPVIRKELQTILEGNKYHTSVIEDFSDVTEQVRKINPHLIFYWILNCRKKMGLPFVPASGVFHRLRLSLLPAVIRIWMN